LKIILRRKNEKEMGKGRKNAKISKGIK